MQNNTKISPHNLQCIMKESYKSVLSRFTLQKKKKRNIDNPLYKSFLIQKTIFSFKVASIVHDNNPQNSWFVSTSLRREIFVAA